MVVAVIVVDVVVNVTAEAVVEMVTVVVAIVAVTVVIVVVVDILIVVTEFDTSNQVRHSTYPNHSRVFIHGRYLLHLGMRFLASALLFPLPFAMSARARVRLRTMRRFIV